MRTLSLLPLGGASLALIVFLSPLRADDPPPSRSVTDIAAAIDRFVEKRLAADGITPSPRTDDAEFLRRAYLDVIGRIPTAEQAAAFLDSQDADKRAKLIDELLASSNYGRHFGIVWSDAIVKRDEMNRNLRPTAFKDWLASGFNDNRPWDKTVRELLTADGTSPQATFFLAHQDMNRFAPQKMVGTVANLFMGVQLQCAECHKHPFVRKWKQEDFWGMAAFYAQTRTSGASGNNAPNTTVAEGAASSSARRPGGGGFQRGGTTPRGAQIEIPDAVDPRKRTGRIIKAKFFEGDEPKLDDKGPFRPALADWLTAKENPFFARASANRLWAHFFGRGLVHPLDEASDDNPPSHPELLKLLAEEFRDSGFDQKHLIRCICNSQAYQRTSKPHKGNDDAGPHLFARMAVKVMSPEVLYDSLTQALGARDLAVPSSGGRPGFGGGARQGGGGGRDAFVAFFTTKEEGDDPSEFSMGIPQFLRLMNSGTFNQGGPVIDRLMKADGATPQTVVEGLFLSVLSRRPTATEVEKLTAYVARKEDQKKGYAGVLWVLLNSAEFMCVR
jgi:hypothetical protein